MLSWHCIFHLAVCTTQGIKALSENKVNGPRSLKLGHPMSFFFLFLTLFQPLSPLYFLICNILSLSLSLSFFIRGCRPSWGYPWTLLRLDLGTGTFLFPDCLSSFPMSLLSCWQINYISVMPTILNKNLAQRNRQWWTNSPRIHIRETGIFS